jgi:hypothetical protein
MYYVFDNSTSRFTQTNFHNQYNIRDGPCRDWPPYVGYWGHWSVNWTIYLKIVVYQFLYA